MATDDLLPDLVNADISNINPRDAITAALIDRSSLAPQMTPEMRARLQTIVQGEVGHGATPEQQQVQLETTLNRALARGQPLEQVTRQYTGPGSSGYYPASTFVGGRIRGPDEFDRFQRTIVDPVLAGSDVGTQRLGFAPTGNASGGVAARGIASGRYNQAGRIGGETYVQQETPAQLARLAALRGQGGGSFNVPAGAPTLTANDLSQDPQFAPGAPPIQVAQADTGTVSDAGNPPIPTVIPKAPEPPQQQTQQQYAPKPSQMPIPPFDYVESQPLGPEPEQPKPLPPSDAMNYAAKYMDNPDVSEGTRDYFKRIYTNEDSYRKELEARATAKWNIDIAQFNKDKDEIEKRRLSKPKDIADLYNALVGGEKTAAEVADLYYKVTQRPMTEAQAAATLAQTRASTVKTEQETEQGKNAFDTITGPDNTTLIRLKGASPDTPFLPAPGSVDMNAVSNIRPNETQSRMIDLAGKAAIAARQGGGSNFAALAGFADTAKGYVPMAGNYLVSDTYRQQLRAADAWVNANIRKESGAAIGMPELQRDAGRYIPKPGDDPQTILDKAEARRGVEELNAAALGNARPILDNFLDGLDKKNFNFEQKKPPVQMLSDDDARYFDLPAGRRFVTPQGEVRTKETSTRFQPRVMVQPPR